MAGSVLYRGDAVGHGHAAVVVRVNSQGNRKQPCHFSDDRPQFGREGTAIRIAQDQRVGTAFSRGLQCPDGILRVVLVSVEEMLGVVDDFLALRLEERERIANHR